MNEAKIWSLVWAKSRARYSRYTRDAIMHDRRGRWVDETVTCLGALPGACTRLLLAHTDAAAANITDGW